MRDSQEDALTRQFTPVQPAATRHLALRNLLPGNIWSYFQLATTLAYHNNYLVQPAASRHLALGNLLPGVNRTAIDLAFGQYGALDSVTISCDDAYFSFCTLLPQSVTRNCCSPGNSLQPCPVGQLSTDTECRLRAEPPSCARIGLHSRVMMLKPSHRRYGPGLGSPQRCTLCSGTWARRRPRSGRSMAPLSPA